MKNRTNTSEKQTFWQQQIAQWQESGQSKREYCRNNGLSYDQFNWWYSRMQKQYLTQIPEGFIQIQYQHPEKAEHICIEMNGIRVQLPSGSSKQLLVTVISAVREVLCV